MISVNQHHNSYSFYLEKNIKSIEAMYHMNVSMDQLKSCIISYIKPAIYSYNYCGQTYFTKKKQFIENLNNCENSYEIMQYVRNTIKKARATEAHTRKVANR